MVIPWDGFPLARLLSAASPTAEREVRALHDALRSRADARAAEPVLEWPYVEGLRLDEAEPRSR